MFKPALELSCLALLLSATLASAGPPGSTVQSARPRLGTTDAVAETLAVTEVRDSFEKSLARVQSASQGTISPEQIRARAYRRAGEVLENVPGVVISQHSGEGKANQYYLRGFNLDHGTDFATTLAGLPVNMPTHGHGQGYSDLNFAIPELVSGIQYKKGPYFAEEGDFASAGTANITYRNTVEQAIGELSVDQDGYARAFAATSTRLRRGPVSADDGDSHTDLLLALEAFHNNGPWDHADDYRKLNGIARLSHSSPTGGFSLSAMGYDGRWNSTDQIPLRAVESGQIGTFGAIDPTDGGASHRYSLSAEWQQVLPGRLTRASAYAFQYRLNLFSNFTYFLDDTTNGDQFEQFDDRRVYGLRTDRTWTGTWGAREIESGAGLSGRYDDIGKVALYSTRARERLSTTREDRVHEGNAAVFGHVSLQWSKAVRATLGLRGDGYRFDVASDNPPNGGTRSAGIVSPKLSFLFGPWDRTAYFVNFGMGYHSNDARGTTIHVDPKSGDPVEPVDPLVRTRGGEVGLRSTLLPNLSTSLALWGLGIDSELLFVGDAGTTEASRPSRRLGVEWTATWRPARRVLADLAAATSRARSTDDDPTGDHIPGASETVVSGGVHVSDLGRFSTGARIKTFGPRALIEDNSVRSKASTLLSAQLDYRFANGLKLGFEALNLLDSKSSDIDYYYGSRLRGEAAGGVDDIHFHPVEPFTLRASLSVAPF